MANYTTKERLSTIEANMKNIQENIININKDMKEVLKISRVLASQKEKIKNNKEKIWAVSDRVHNIEKGTVKHLWSMLILAAGIIINFILILMRKNI